MRQRLSSKFVTFNKVKGEDFYKDFFNEDGTLEIEEAIESVYNAQHMKATSFGVKIIKKSGRLRGTTDGFIYAYINQNGHRYVNFYGIQECKRDIKRYSKAYYESITQGLLYAVQWEGIKVLILPSVRHFDYIFLDEIDIDKTVLLDALGEGSPSTMCKKISINIDESKIHKMDMPTSVEIDKAWKEIYKHCIEL